MLFLKSKAAGLTTILRRKVKQQGIVNRWRRLVGWLLAIAFCVFLGYTGYLLFSRTGMLKMKGWLDDAYESCPVERRREHWSAGWYLRLAWWESSVLKRHEDGARLYREFLGIGDMDGKLYWDGNDVYKWGPKFRGWGPTHPLACIAYFRYLEACQNLENKEHFVETEGLHYFVLFHNMYPSLAGTGAPHPQFYRYWDCIANRYIAAYGTRPPLPMPIPPNFDPPEDGL